MKINTLKKYTIFFIKGIYIFSCILFILKMPQTPQMYKKQSQTIDFTVFLSVAFLNLKKHENATHILNVLILLSFRVAFLKSKMPHFYKNGHFFTDSMLFYD